MLRGESVLYKSVLLNIYFFWCCGRTSPVNDFFFLTFFSLFGWYFLSTIFTMLTIILYFSFIFIILMIINIFVLLVFTLTLIDWVRTLQHM